MKKLIPGILLCLLIAIPIWLLVQSVPFLEVIGAPVLGILCGMLLAPVVSKPYFTQGIQFTSKKVLQYAIILLGFGLNLKTVARVGLYSLPIIVTTISVSLLVAFLCYRRFHIPGKTAVLIGVGSSICGGSAIAATAPVIHAKDEEIAQAISVIFFFNVLAALLFPTLGQWLHLTSHEFGLFAGSAINDTSSVTAAASTWDSMHHSGTTVLDYATIVKLTRTLAIIPITLGLSFLELKKEHGSTSLKGSFPMFILYFMAASLFTTIIMAVCTGQTLHTFETVFGWMKLCSKFMIVTAMTAIGLNSNMITLVKKGGRPLLLGFLCSGSIAFMSIFILKVFL